MQGFSPGRITLLAVESPKMPDHVGDELRPWLLAAMLAQVLCPGGGNRNAGAAFRCRLARDEATLLSGLPNRQARTRRPPGLENLAVGAWARADPFEEIDDEGVDTLGHDGLS
jgi:hypothetical protein